MNYRLLSSGGAPAGIHDSLVNSLTFYVYNHVCFRSTASWRQLDHVHVTLAALAYFLRIQSRLLSLDGKLMYVGNAVLGVPYHSHLTNH